MPPGQPRIHALWNRLARSHGPLFRVQVPGKTFVVCTDPALLPSILGRPGLPKTPMYRITRPLFSAAGADNMFTVLSIHDRGWSDARKAFACNVSPSNVEARFPGVLAVSLRCAQAIAEWSASGGGALDAQDACQRLALDMILGAAYGQDPGAAADLARPCALLDAFHTAFDEIYLSLTNPLRPALHRAAPWLAGARKAGAARETMYAAWARLVAVTRAVAPPPPGDTSYLACLNRLRDPVGGGPYSTPALTSQIGATVIAGTDTTAHAAAWALWSVAAHPPVQARLAAELAEAGLGASPSNPRPRPPAYADLAAGRLPYLDAVIAESMRMWPVGGAGIGRWVDRPEGVSLGGFHLPYGTEVATPLFALHRAAWCWERPDEFWPERWLDGGEDGVGGPDALIRAGWPAAGGVAGGRGEPARAPRPPPVAKEAATKQPRQPPPTPCSSGEVASHSWSAKDAAAHRLATTGETLTEAWARGGASAACAGAAPVTRAAYLPYAGGPRECLGRRFAAMELATALCVLVGAFEWSPDEERMGGDGVEAREVSRFTLAVEGGIWLTAVPRSGGSGVGWDGC